MADGVNLQMDSATLEAALALIDAGLREDLRDRGDLTSQATIPADAIAAVELTSREPGVLCGTALIELIYSRLTDQVTVDLRLHDGDRVERSSLVARISGPIRALLTGERTVLNLISHLSGVATKTARFVDSVRGTRAVILDTRKTLPGYRLVQKYAVRCGGGTNHRMGLFDGILIKDNHLAARHDPQVATAVREARLFLRESNLSLPVEVEVDSLAQLRDVLAESPDIVLLDNMSVDELREAVAIRGARRPATLLEASGGVALDTVGAIAATGVDRISIGGLTHSAPALDLGFDWPDCPRTQ